MKTPTARSTSARTPDNNYTTENIYSDNCRNMVESVQELTRAWRHRANQHPAGNLASTLLDCAEQLDELLNEIARGE